MLRRKVNREEHPEVPAELQKWVWGDGKQLPGLVKRRAAEAAFYDRLPSRRLARSVQRPTQ